MSDLLTHVRLGTIALVLNDRHVSFTSRLTVIQGELEDIFPNHGGYCFPVRALAIRRA